MNKREWLKKLKALKSNPDSLKDVDYYELILTGVEIDELILLLGGTVRENHRPVKLINGWNPRHINWGGLGALVFGFMENAERLAELEAESQKISHPDYLKNALAGVPEQNRAECERVGLKKLTDNLAYLKKTIEILHPRSAKTRSEAIRLAVLWFKSRGISKSEKQIENELTRLQEAYGLKQLQLEEWRIIKAKSDETAALIHETVVFEESAARKKRAAAICLAARWGKRRGG